MISTKLQQLTQKVNHYDIVSKKFKEVDLTNHFFDSFRMSYDPYFTEWCKLKATDDVFIVEDNNKILGFLKLKIEDISEDYSDMSPLLSPNRRLKISSMKVANGNPGLSDKLMNLTISFAMFNNVNEIYGTVPVNADYLPQVLNFLKRYNFKEYGIKNSHSITEKVLVKYLKIK